ncbi:TPA: hypothetical protein DCX16_06340 [bacterium]|nr:hypothetical protein [bacterium]
MSNGIKEGREMKLILLVLILAFVEDGFCRCPNCPERQIKREVRLDKPVRKQVIKRKVPDEIKKEVIREKPPISSVQQPYESPISFLFKKQDKITLPDGTVFRFIREEDLKRVPDLP